MAAKPYDPTLKALVETEPELIRRAGGVNPLIQNIVADCILNQGGLRPRCTTQVPCGLGKLERRGDPCSSLMGYKRYLSRE